MLGESKPARCLGTRQDYRAPEEVPNTENTVQSPEQRDLFCCKLHRPSFDSHQDLLPFGSLLNTWSGPPYKYGKIRENEARKRLFLGGSPDRQTYILLKSAKNKTKPSELET